MITIDSQGVHVNDHSPNSILEQRIAAGPQRISPPSAAPVGLVSPKTGGPYTGSSSSTGSISSAGEGLHKASPSDIIFGTPAGSDPTSRAAQSLATSPSSLCGSSDHGRTGSRSRSRSRGQQSQGKQGGKADRVAQNGVAQNGGTTSTLPPTPEVTIQPTPSVPVTQGESAEVKVVPFNFEDSYPDDIVVLVADMLGRLVAHNDHLPLHPSSLTRFHSRTPPGISIASYLRRIARYTSLEKACTLIILVYIDRVCESLKGFTICSLTVHRFTCAAVVCACKALCDAFSTNGHYARVGGISLVELNMLEKEFLDIIGWRLTCSGALLQHYYVSLVRSHPAYTLAEEPESDDVEETQTRGRQGKVIEPTLTTSSPEEGGAPRGAAESPGFPNKGTVVTEKLNGFGAMPRHGAAASSHTNSPFFSSRSERKTGAFRNSSASRERGRDRTEGARSRSRSVTGRSRSAGAGPKASATGGMVARMPRKRRRRREEGDADDAEGNEHEDSEDEGKMEVDLEDDEDEVEGEDGEPGGRERRSFSKGFAGMEIDGEEKERGRSEVRR